MLIALVPLCLSPLPLPVVPSIYSFHLSSVRRCSSLLTPLPPFKIASFPFIYSLSLSLTQTRIQAHSHTHARIHTHTRIHTRIHTHSHTYTHAYTHTHTRTHTHTHAYTHTRIHTLTHACIHTRTHSHAYVGTDTHTHTHTHSHAYVRTDTERTFLRRVSSGQLRETEALLRGGVNVHVKNTFDRDAMQVLLAHYYSVLTQY